MIGPKTFYDDLGYWVGPIRIRPKSIYDENNYWAPSNQNKALNNLWHQQY
jgi:hypothetical protein